MCHKSTAIVSPRFWARSTIVIGSVLDMPLSSRTAALAYWQGRYVAIDQNEDAIKLAKVSLPAPRILRKL